MTALVEAVDVVRRFGATTVLREVSLRVDVGDRVAIVGQSGSGKSTLLHLLGLMDRPTSGEIRFDGVDLAGHRERDRAAIRARDVGFVFQAFHLLGRRTVIENVETGLLYQGVGSRERRERALAALADVGLSHRIDALPTTLSGGERQRVAVARALAQGSRLLLADEPTGNLDRGSTRRLLDLLDRVVGPSMAFVVVTHDQVVAERAARVYRMDDGVLGPEGG
mgnify:CR=1 FL=1